MNGCDQKGVLHWLRIMQKWLLEKRMQWHNYPWLTIRFPWKTLPSLSGFSSVQSWKLWKKKQTNTLVWVQFDYYYYCVRAEKDTMGRRPKTRNIEKEADTVCYIYIYIYAFFCIWSCFMFMCCFQCFSLLVLSFCLLGVWKKKDLSLFILMLVWSCCNANGLFLFSFSFSYNVYFYGFVLHFALCIIWVLHVFLWWWK